MEEELRPCIDQCDGSGYIKHGMSSTRKILAHAYVPWQTYDKAFSPREALAKGTLFPDLWGVYRIPK
ncbi:MAG: Spore coat associated protein (CotJA) [Firmicutes bacterium]|nr:Spore coat associated protein (CotJA) [Bacillota bacterium]